MSLPHAILGVLNTWPMSGYDLKTQVFDHSVAHFWPAVLPQIYRELEKMEQAGWVASQIQVQQGKPNRRVYHISPSGQAELLRYLRSDNPPPAQREAFLVQLFFSVYLSNAEIVERLAYQRTVHLERLRALQAIHIPPQPPSSPEDRRERITALTLQMGLRYEQMYIDWLEECMTQVQSWPLDANAPDPNL